MQRYRGSTQCAAWLPTWSGAACSRVHRGLHGDAAVGLLCPITGCQGCLWASSGIDWNPSRMGWVPGVPGVPGARYASHQLSLPASATWKGPKGPRNANAIGLSHSVAVVSTAILDFSQSKEAHSGHTATQRNTTVDYWRGSSHALHTACRLLP